MFTGSHKTVKRMTIILLIFATIFLSFSQVLLAQKAKAQNQNPPHPDDITVKFSFTNTDLNEVMAEATAGTVHTNYYYEKVENILHPLSSIKNSDIPKIASGSETILAKDGDSIVRLEAIKKNPDGTTLPVDKCTNNRAINLIIWKPASIRLWTVAGVYIFVSEKWQYVSSSDLNSGKCSAIGRSDKMMANTIISTNNSVQPTTSTHIFNTLNTADKDAVCTNMSVAWEKVKDNIRELLTTAPPGNYWQDAGKSAVGTAINLTAINLILGGAAGARFGGAIGLGVGLVSGAVLTSIEASWGTRLEDTNKWELNEQGRQVLSTIYYDVRELENDIQLLNNGSNENTWPCSQKLTIFKYDKNLETVHNAGTYSTISDFSNAVDETIKQFENFKAIIETPTTSSTGDEGICGGLTSANPDVILGVMTCSIALMIHNAAVFLMKEAYFILNKSIGLGTQYNLQFEEPGKKSPSSTTTTPAADTTSTITGTNP